MSLILDGTNGTTFNDGSNQPAAASPYVLKNKIINGDCRIDQRNAGASVTLTASDYTLDRWRAGLSASSKYSVQQNAGSVTPPVGFTNYLGVTSLSSYSVLTSDQFLIQQRIEGFNIADLDWGTANAKTVTLSFWVRSSLTGTFGGSLRNGAANRSYPFSYAISTANTWEQKTITIAGDTSGTWLTNNGIGFVTNFDLGTGATFSGTAGAWAGANYVSATGATSVVGTNGATWYVTGVQLEQNTSATPFERRLYGQELVLCERYCQFNRHGVGANSSSTAGNGQLALGTAMRATPTVFLFNGTNALIDYGVSQRNITALGAIELENEFGLLLNWTSSATTGSYKIHAIKSKTILALAEL
jgi:hypothetical protein